MGARFFFYLFAIICHFWAISANALVPILTTDSKTAQCETLMDWIGHAREIGGQEIFTAYAEVSSERRKAAPAFADPVFSKTFGRSYWDLSRRNKKTILKIVKRCSENNKNFYYTTVQQPFQLRTDRGYLTEWRAEIDKYKNGANPKSITSSRTTVAKKTNSNIRRGSSAVAIKHRAGELLLNGNGYDVFALKRTTWDFEPACRTNNRDLVVSIVIEDHNTIVDRRFVQNVYDNTLKPMLSEHCLSRSENFTIYSEFFFKDVHLSQYSNRLPSNNFDVSTVALSLHERPFLRARETVGQYPMFDYTYHNGKRPTQEELPYYQTLASFERFARQGLKTDQQIARDKAALLLQIQLDSKAESLEQQLAGFVLAGKGGRELVSGVQPDSFFKSAPNSLVKAVMGYAVAVSENCPSRKVPGGVTILSYTSWTVTTDRYTGQETEGDRSTKSFKWPRDFEPLVRNAVDQSNNFNFWLDAAKTSEYYEDVFRLIKTKGCGSQALQNYHDNLLSVATENSADWKNMGGMLEQLRRIWNMTSGPQ